MPRRLLYALSMPSRDKILGVASWAVPTAVGAGMLWIAYRSGKGIGRGGKYAGGSGGTPGSSLRAKRMKISRAEPAGGWQARWLARKNAAIESCRARQGVNSYTDAKRCILTEVFREASPWVSEKRSGWQPWMSDAYDAVQQEIIARTKAYTGGGGAPGWQFFVWFRFEREFNACRNAGNTGDIVQCIALRFYPAADYPDFRWPPVPLPNGDVPTWQFDLWNMLAQRVTQYLNATEAGFGA